MTAVLARATHRIERYRRQNSDAVRLTRLASLAVRVEPYLLRRLRLELLPELDVGTEADVWFGPLVESRGTDAIVLDPHAADVLRDDLAADRELLRQVRRITRDTHQGSPPAIRLEEEVNALALLNEGDVVAAIDETLRPAIRAICKGGDPAREIAHWARRALARVHPTVRRSQGWALLRLASDSILGTAPLMKTPDADVSADALAWILPTTALSERVSLGVELVQRGLRFVTPVAQTPALDLPRTDPLLVELEWGGARRRTKRLVEAEIGRTLDLDDDASEITLRTLAGDEYVLERARHIEFDNDVFISYAHIDDQVLTEGQQGWISSLHRALQVRLEQILGKEARIWRDPKLQGNDVFSDQLLDRLPSVAVFIAVLSPRYIRSEWCQRELKEFVTAAASTGGIRVAERMRVFKVLKAPIPLEQQPPELRNMLGYEFFRIDPETGRVHELDSMSSPDRQPDYWIKLDDLAHDIADMVNRLAVPDSAPPSPSNEGSSPRPSVEARRIYLICDQRDLEAVRPLMDLLFERCEVTLPVFEGDESQIRREHEVNLVECDAVLVYYGAGSELWLRSKLRELEKVAGYGRTRPMLAKALYVAPPVKPEMRQLPRTDMIIIQGGNVPIPDALAPFLEKLADSDA